MNKVAKIFSYIAFVFAFCCMAIGYAAVQDELLVNGTVSVDGYILKYDFSAADTEGYTLSADGKLEIKEIYYDPNAVNPNNKRVGVNYRVVTIADNGFSGYESKGGVTTLVLPDSVHKVGENAFSDFTKLSEVQFGSGFTEIRPSSFNTTYLNESNMIVKANSLVVCNQLGADISKYVTNSTSYTIELASAYGADRGVVTAYTGDTAEVYGYASVAESKFELGNNGKIVDLLSTERYTYATLDESNGLHIKNRYGYILSDNNQLLEADGTYPLGTDGVVYALPTSASGTCIAVINEDSSVPAGAIESGAWTIQTTADRNNITEFEKSITSVVVADPIKLQGDLRNLFYGCAAMNTADLTNADFSAVTNLYEFFDGCTNLKTVRFDNENIDTSNVTNMAKMFSLCNSLSTLNLSGFDTPANISMYRMFYNCKALTSLDLSDFQNPKVENMSEMFNGCTGLKTLILSNFGTSAATGMTAMFNDCNQLTSLNLSSFNTSNVTDMSSMFRACKSLKSIEFGSNFNTSKVSGMGQMFAACSSLDTLDVSQFNTSNVTDMGSMFQYCSVLTTLNLSNFNTSKVESMRSMFLSCGNLTTLIFGKDFDTSAVTNMSGMFNSCSKLSDLDLSGFDTSAVTNMSAMFRQCGLTTLDLSNFDTYEVTDMNNMFRQAGSLTTIYVSDGFVVNEGVITTDMFAYCNNLIGGSETSYANAKVTDGTYARVDGGVDSPGYFTAHKVGSSWTDTNDGRHHSGTCTIHTDEIILETHTFVNGVCSKCENKCNHDIFHNWKTDEDGGTTHSRACLCGQTVETKEHTYSNNKCSVCGQCNHNVTIWTSVDENTHKGNCTRCEKDVIKEHTYTDGECICGKKETDADSEE